MCVCVCGEINGAHTHTIPLLTGSSERGFSLARLQSRRQLWTLQPTLVEAACATTAHPGTARELRERGGRERDSMKEREREGEGQYERERGGGRGTV